jgi:hypothetical protein
MPVFNSIQNVDIWNAKCLHLRMHQLINPFFKVLVLPAVLALLIAPNAPAANTSTVEAQSSAGLAFARYVATIRERDPFSEPGPVGVTIEASLPALYKETQLIAIRDVDESERSQYRVLKIEGDAIVAQEVIARYLLVQEQLEDLPSSGVAITPANYKFRYVGEVGTGIALAYKYEITPRKKRKGLFQGQIWIDSVTGAAILQAGRFVKMPSPLLGNVRFVREAEVTEGNTSIRVTHVTIETQHAGRGELTITEIPLTADGQERQSKSDPLAVR